MSDAAAAPVEAVDQALVGANVRAAREEKGWTRHDLSTRSGVRENTIYRIEAGQVMPSLDSIDRIGKALDKTVDQLTTKAAS
ncbi:MAG: Helix-turn-helix domain [Actinomycetia bacterium]|nr:Helix-turn-helix domain [Actinomycetes bacterium]